MNLFDEKNEEDIAVAAMISRGLNSGPKQLANPFLGFKRKNKTKQK